MRLHLGDCVDVLKTIPDNSIDSLVTDPPAGIEFMGKDWDSDRGGRENWVTWFSSIMRQVHRVLKPGAHGLIWAIPRTSHWTGTALEDAGFEVRDQVFHIQGQGFPKSLNISKAMNKIDVLTEGAKQWDGWGTALKPACEIWILVRKPISEKNIAENVLKWGCGGIHIDACRIDSKDLPEKITISHNAGSRYVGKYNNGKLSEPEPRITSANPTGRFPSHLLFSHNADCDDQCTDGCPVKGLNEQSGFLHPSGNKHITQPGRIENSIFKIGSVYGHATDYKDGGGGASRFFYCAKVSTRERNTGLDEIKNHHPTVKPQKLMRYLSRLITPPHGTILDPFMGSGSTGIAALTEGFDFIGIEKDEDYFKIAQKRIEHSQRET